MKSEKEIRKQLKELNDEDCYCQCCDGKRDLLHWILEIKNE